MLLIGAVLMTGALWLWRDRHRDPVITALAETIRQAKFVELHEGAGRSERESDPGSHAEEDEPVLVALGTERMYRLPTKWHGADAQTLNAILSDATSFAPLRPKGCKGFHADFVLEWKSDGESSFALICFGCGELRVVTPSAAQTYDQAQDVQWDLLRILRNYREHRPPGGDEFWRDLNPDGTMAHSDKEHAVALEPYRGVPRWGAPHSK